MRVRTLLIVIVVLGLLLGGGYAISRYLGGHRPPPAADRACTVTAGGVVTLDAEQLANTATIAAVGIRRQLPERAVTIALATAYQESKFRNLPGGDRDSVGLFQQRPSQGWGTAEQINDPRYAAGKFYDKLVKIPGWETMRVTDAAQAVQVSAYPGLYERWVDRAEVLARALRGTATRAVTCTLSGDPNQRGVTALRSLIASVKLDWGLSGASAANTLSLRPHSDQTGWQYAHWLVTRAQAHGVRAVRYAGMEWTARQGTWARSAAGQDSSAVTETVTAEVYS